VCSPGETLALALFHLSNGAQTPRRRFIKSVLLWALLHYVLLSSLGFAIFLLSHLPPKVLHLDPAIFVLVQIENVLLALRKLLLWLWPFERTPRGLGFVLTVVNSLAWGFALAALRACWRKAAV